MALAEIAALPNTEIIKKSGIYYTEPQDDTEQDWFYNQVVAVTTGFEPLNLLYALQSIETKLGRNRDPARRFGPRTMDLDILIYARVTLNSANLVVPHPRLSKRAFVLIPLIEIASENILEELKADLEKISFVLDGDKIFQRYIN
jgi:2-amino-4-hydroxy-6-hydroxymethyldihydropteridine diphosphokinase